MNKTIRQMRKARQQYAKELRDTRASWRELKVKTDVRRMNEITRRLVAGSWGGDKPIKPTERNLAAAWKRAWAYSQAAWHNRYDSEYYSACGYDDYQADLRHQAKEYAVELFRAWKCVRFGIPAGWERV